MLPKFVVDMLKQKYSFSDADVQLIGSNWEYYANYGFRFGSASEARILRECKLVLACAKTENFGQV